MSSLQLVSSTVFELEYIGIRGRDNTRHLQGIPNLTRRDGTGDSATEITKYSSTSPAKTIVLNSAFSRKKKNVMVILFKWAD